MTLGRYVAFWLIAFLVILALLWSLSAVLLPFVAGLVLAYLGAPLADRLERLGIHRTIAGLLIVSVVVVAILALVLLLVPLFVQQGLALANDLPGYLTRVRELLAEHAGRWLQWFGGGDSTKTETEFAKQAAAWLAGFAASLWAGGKALVSLASILVIMPVVTFYLICDWHDMIEFVDGLIPLCHRQTVRELARDMDAAISAFLRGQLGVCCVLGAYYGVALTLTGLNFGLLIGLLSGLLTFVPYVGFLTGLLVGTSVAVAQFWPDWKWIVGVIAIFLVGQFLEGSVLTPKLVGNRIGLHPVWMIFAMFAFGYLFGFVGLLAAVPLAAAIAVLSRFGLRQYLASPVYTGEKPG
jgi:predicted PurR-regulated permease PerM